MVLHTREPWWGTWRQGRHKAVVFGMHPVSQLWPKQVQARSSCGPLHLCHLVDMAINVVSSEDDRPSLCHAKEALIGHLSLV